MSIKTHFLFVNRSAPYGSVNALESLEVVLITAALEQMTSLVFMDDGVYQLLNNQMPKESIGQKNYSKAFKALADYDVNKVYVEKESLEQRGLSSGDLLDLPNKQLENGYDSDEPLLVVVCQKEITAIMNNCDVIYNF